MGNPSLVGAVLCLCLSVFFAGGFCHGSDLKVEVVGVGECADCKEKSIKASNAFSGLHVTIDCKAEDGKLQRKGEGELDEEGKFKVLLSKEMLKDGELKEKCYAQLHSAAAAAAPCPAHESLESSRLVFKSKTDAKHTFGLPGGLKFSTLTCASAFLWKPKFPKFPKKPCPLVKPPTPKPPGPKPPKPPAKKPKPPGKKPPKPVYKHPFLKHLPPIPKIPFFKKPCPPIPKLPKLGKLPPLPVPPLPVPPLVPHKP